MSDPCIQALTDLLMVRILDSETKAVNAVINSKFEQAGARVRESRAKEERDKQAEDDRRERARLEKERKDREDALMGEDDFEPDYDGFLEHEVGLLGEGMSEL